MNFKSLFYIPVLESEDTEKASPQKVATGEPKEMVRKLFSFFLHIFIDIISIQRFFV